MDYFEVAGNGKACRLLHAGIRRYDFSINPHEIAKLRDLYPTLTSEELAEAESNLAAYIIIVLRIFHRLEQEAGGASAKIIGTLSCTPPDLSSSGNPQQK